MEKNKRYYLIKADDAILDAIFDLCCAEIADVGPDDGIKDSSITTLIRALSYARETIRKLEEYTYEKDN